MSTVKATHFEHPSASSPGITLGSDGSVVLPSGFTGGLGTNVVQTVKTDTFTTSSTTFTNITGLSVTITPASATSKILLIADLKISGDELNAVRFDGGNSGNYVGDAASNRVRAGAGAVSSNFSSFNLRIGMFATPMVYLDSPATASPVTYNVQARVESAASIAFYLNRSEANDADEDTTIRVPSSLTAIEVAA